MDGTVEGRGSSLYAHCLANRCCGGLDTGVRTVGRTGARQFSQRGLVEPCRLRNGNARWPRWDASGAKHYVGRSIHSIGSHPWRSHRNIGRKDQPATAAHPARRSVSAAYAPLVCPGARMVPRAGQERPCRPHRGGSRTPGRCYRPRHFQLAIQLRGLRVGLIHGGSTRDHPLRCSGNVLC